MSASEAPRLVLCILDGVGQPSGPHATEGNAIAAADPVFFQSLLERFPHTTLEPGGPAVGLPEGQMGNSEVGHLTIGAGRVIPQELVRIGNSFDSGEFAQAEAWGPFTARVRESGGTLHLLGLVSPGGVHSHTDHLLGIVREATAAGIEAIAIHAFMDGRDTDPHAGAGYLADLQTQLATIGAGRIATVCGRYWAMDRDKRWDRVEKAWAMLVRGQGEKADDPVAAVEASYAQEVTDEFIAPTVITDQAGTPLATIGDGDGVFFWNFRADRARELTWAFNRPGFDEFPVADRPQVTYLCMTPYDETMDLPVMFRPVHPRNGLAEIFAREGLRNLRTAETEKYAHVTYFFNGGREEPFSGEERHLVPSPKVATYDLQPEMSAHEVAEVVATACAGHDQDVIIVNFANGDMVGHTGNFKAAVAAFKTLDHLLGELMPPSLARGTTWLVTADHGNCDEMIGPDGAPLTQHSLNPVPFIVASPSLENRTDALEAGLFGLADIAPTVLQVLGIAPPPEMTGRSILKANCLSR